MMTDAELEAARCEELAAAAKKRFFDRDDSNSEEDWFAMTDLSLELQVFCENRENGLTFNEIVEVFTEDERYNPEMDSFDDFSGGAILGFTDAQAKTILSDERYIKALSHLWRYVREHEDEVMFRHILAESYDFVPGNAQLAKDLLRRTGHWDARMEFTLPFNCFPEYYRGLTENPYACDPDTIAPSPF